MRQTKFLGTLTPMNASTELQWIDYLIILIYFSFVLGIGFFLRRYMRTSVGFSRLGTIDSSLGRGFGVSLSNLGAQEVVGMAASGAKYGICYQSFLLAGCDSRDGFRRNLHDAFLLRL
jgi:SSS family solute:Na+ symporter